MSIFNLIIFYFYNNSLVANKDYQALPRYFALEKGRMQFLSMKNTQQVSNNTASHTKYHLYHCNECNLNLNIFSGPPASQLGMAGITVEFVKLFFFLYSRFPGRYFCANALGLSVLSHSFLCPAPGKMSQQKCGQNNLVGCLLLWARL